MTKLEGKTALVTGASRGIGQYTAKRLASVGARVGVPYAVNEEGARETVAAIEGAGGSAFAVQAEFGTPGCAESLWGAFDQHANAVDIIVNNAGDAVYGRIHEIAEEDFDRQITVNAVAPGPTTMSYWLADPSAKAWADAQSALGRVGAPDDIGDIIAFLASDDARWITGQVLDATGGGLLGVSKIGDPMSDRTRSLVNR
jgi:NAD(P)-dependent dehydrogenase (short-subunit alcohol dehydrogenase family)